MTLRPSLLKALDRVVDEVYYESISVGVHQSLSLSTSTKRSSRGGQVVMLHVGGGSFEVCEASRGDVTSVEAAVLAEATSYIHGRGGQVR